MKKSLTEIIQTGRFGCGWVITLMNRKTFRVIAHSKIAALRLAEDISSCHFNRMKILFAWKE